MQRAQRTVVRLRDLLEQSRRAKEHARVPVSRPDRIGRAHDAGAAVGADQWQRVDADVVEQPPPLLVGHRWHMRLDALDGVDVEQLIEAVRAQAIGIEHQDVVAPVWWPEPGCHGPDILVRRAAPRIEGWPRYDFVVEQAVGWW